tara:strand:+ start:424 stop:1440 length:1017 start_codon:yes stop_codon:yes gene_type:complete
VPAKLGPKGKVLRYPEDLIDHTTDYFQIEVLKNIKNTTGGLGSLIEETAPAVAASVKDDGTKIPEKKAVQGFKDNDIKLFGGSSGKSHGNQISDQHRNVPAEKIIILPIPQNIKDNNGVSWGESQLNDFAAFGLTKIGEVMNTNSIGEAGTVLKNTAKESADLVKANGTSIAQYGKMVAGVAAANALGANVSVQGLLSRATGQIINQNVEMLFNGVQVRTFNFGFDLVPRSIDESTIVKDIIRTLKIKSAAKMKKDNMGFLNAPNLFRLSYMKGGHLHPFLNSFKTCALKNIAVTYTGSGTYATYEDGTPVHMKLDLTFTELNPIYSEDHDHVGGVGY